MATNVVILKSRLTHLGGLEKHALWLAKEFVARGCHVTILSTGNTDVEDSPFRVINLCRHSSLGAIQLRRYDRLCRKWLKEHPADIVFGMDRNNAQTHYRAGNGVHAAYLQQRKKYDPLLKRLSFSINPLHRTILSLEQQCFEHPELEILFTNSRMVKEEILQHYETNAQKIQVIHNGVEWKEMQENFEQWPLVRSAWLTEFDLDPSCYQFLFVGQGYRRKGLHALLRGLAHLKNRDVQLSVVGQDKEIRTFEALTHQLDIAQQVKFFGSRNDVRRFYQAADALAIPSIYDPFANVTVEALAMGLFVVSSKTNGGREILSPSSGCIIEDLSSIESIAQSLLVALNYPKTPPSATLIRNQVQHLDFQQQQHKMVSAILQGR